VPPLRERKQDIPLLVDTFLEKLSRQSSGKKKTLSQDSLNLLMEYQWPGNVRELKNLLERLFIMVETDHIHLSDIPEPYNPKIKSIELMEKNLFLCEEDLSQAKKRFEREFIRQRLEREGGDVTSAAKKLGTSVKYIKKSLS
jgi:two-component system nitrogen regulation response regulator NtrX